MFAFVLLLVLVAAKESYKYTLAIEWPGSICRANSCKKEYVLNYDGSHFSIHGLWPDLYDQGNCQMLSSCSQEQYNPNVISQETLAVLDKSWVGFYSSIQSFRDHEWSKHGTCWKGEPLNVVSRMLQRTTKSFQEDYFQTVYALSSQFNVLLGLKTAGIIPSDSQIYTLDQINQGIIQTIQNNTNLKVSSEFFSIQCSKDPHSSNSMLEQVQICLDTTYKPMSCNCKNQLQSGDCGRSIMVPQFQKP